MALDELAALRDRLEQQSPRFSPSEARLAADLIEHADRWAFLSSTQLARHLGLHRSTVIRFAQRAGYAGYPELQASVRSAYLNSVSGAPELVLDNGQGEGAALVSGIFQRELENLRQTYRNLPSETLHLAADGIGCARRVLVFGRRFSYPIALYLSRALRVMRPSVELAPEPGGTAIDLLFDLGKEDHALVVSMRRYSPEVQRTLRYLASRQVPCTLLTDTSPTNSFPEDANVLQAYIGGAGLLDSYTALTSVAHVLLSLVAAKRPGAEARLAQAERAWRHLSEDQP